MADYIECCNVCGCTIFLRANRKYPECLDCEAKNSVYQSKYTRQYYEEKAQEEFNDISYWKEILVKTELSKQPSFSYEKYKMSCEMQKDRDKRGAERKKREEEQAKNPPISQPTTNTPKCPTCGSTKIKKISSVSKVAGAALFGLFSKTARSQFQCENCGYKW